MASVQYGTDAGLVWSRCRYKAWAAAGAAAHASCWWPKLLSPDRVTGDDEFDAPILLAPCRGAIGRHRLVLSEPGSRNRLRGDLLLHQICAHRPRAPLRQVLVV